MSRIKICGLRRTEDVDYVNEFKPDYAGFIYVPGRTRNVEPELGKLLKARLDPHIKAVGVFLNEEREKIASIYDDGLFDIIQLHGQESKEDVKWLRDRTGAQVIKAVSVKTSDDIRRWEESEADYLLLDNGNGGTGKSFDWKLICHMTKPYFIAGGINADNLSEALGYKPYGVDISGGVEKDGFKNRELIKKVIEIVRRQR